jgi:cardiolipin-specific phospholipase
LILLSPAGIPDHPEKGPDIPDGEVLEAAAKELTEPQTETADAPRNSKPSMPKRPTYRSAPPTELTVSGTETERAAYSRQNSTASVDSNERFAEDKEAKKGNQGLWKKAVYYMWEEGVSPFGLVRKLGPMGPMLVARYSTRRFGALPEEDIKDLHEYIWS